MSSERVRLAEEMQAAWSDTIRKIAAQAMEVCGPTAAERELIDAAITAFYGCAETEAASQANNRLKEAVAAVVLERAPDPKRPLFEGQHYVVRVKNGLATLVPADS